MKRRRISIKQTACIALSCVVLDVAWAQTAPDAGSIQRDQRRPALELPVRPAAPFRIDETPRPAPKASDARMLLNSVSISGNTVFTQAELLALVQDFIGKEVGLAELDEATARLSRHYREHGYLVARAYLARAYQPGMGLKDGIAEIAIIEGTIGKADVLNRSSVRAAVLRDFTDAFPGTVVRERNLERRLLLLGDLGGVSEARASLKPGANVGETDLTVEIGAAPTVGGSAEWDNHGNRFTGASRVGARFNIANPLGLGDALSARAMQGFADLEYARLAYQLPLGGDGMKAGASISNSRYRLGKSFAALEAQGESDSASLNLSYPFIRSRELNLYGQLSHDWGDFQDRVDSTGTVTAKQTRSLSMALSGDIHDAVGGGGVTSFQILFSAGRLNILTPAARAIDAASARSHGSYGKLNLNLLRLQSLGEQASLLLSFAAQKADKNLDSSEKFALGGASGVRAYPQGEAAGDSGYLASVEWRYSFSLEKLPGLLRPFLFLDAGAVTVNEKPFAAGPNRRRLSAFGIGLTWLKAQDFQLQLTLATRSGRQAATSDTDRSPRVWLQATKYF